jgi:acyl-CoA hydrolase
MPRDLPPKPVSESRVEMVEMILPNDANPIGTASGGKILHLIDIAAAIAAMRHCRRQVVTASFDEVAFHHPVRVGDLVILKASVNFVARSSMEIGVKVLSENPKTGERRHTASAYTTFVALDDLGHPTHVAPLTLESNEDRRRNEQGRLRREHRIATREQRSTREGTL